MQKSPHMLIEGMVIAAYAAGVNRSFIYIRGEYELQADILDAAIAEAARAGYLGERILGSDHSLSLVLHRGAGAYICGEETALLDSLEGKRGNPRLKPPFPANQGLYQGPTLINNVETLATVPHIIRMGGEEYAKLGAAGSTGTKLVSVSGQRAAPGQLRDRAGHPVARDHLRPRRRPAGGPRGQALVPGRLLRAGADRRGRPRPPLRLRLAGQGRLDARLGRDHRRRRLDPRRRRRAEAGEVLPPRVLRQVHAVPRGHQLDREDARAHRHRRGHADGPRHHGRRPGAHHRQLPVRAGRRDGDADRLDGRQVPRRVRGPHRGRAVAQRARRAGDGRRRLRSSSGGAPDAAPRSADDHLHDRRPRGQRARERDAGRRRQARRRRDPGLLLRAQARRAGRRLPHVPGRDRGHPEAADRLLDAGQGRHGRPHPDRARQARRSRRSSSSCSSTTRSTARSATRAASARCRTSPSAGAAASSRFIEPKRHFQKPLELSPLVAIDRERCILCYRCVRFTQEVSEDYQLVLLERGAHTYVGDLRRPPLRRALQRQHHRALPGGRADLAAPTASARARGTSRARARSARCARRSATSPSRSATSASCACSRATTPRSTTAGCATRAASPTRRSTSTSASPSRWSATAASCARSPGSARSTRPPTALGRANGRVGALAGGETTNEEGFLLQRLMREGLGSPDIDSRAGGTLPLELHRALAAPGAAGDGPRPRVRPRRARARLRARRRHADPRPAHPQGRAPPRREARGRHQPPVVAGSQCARERPLRARRGRGLPARAVGRASTGPALAGDAAGAAAGAERRRAARWSQLREAGEDVVILYGERLVSGPRGAQAAPRAAATRRAPEACSAAAATARACSACRPPPTAAACARPACCPTPGPASPQTAAGRDAAAIAAGARGGELTALYLLHADPLTELPGPRRHGTRRSSTPPP